MSTMRSDEQILSRRQKNLICAKRNYVNKKKMREDLVKKNEELVETQISLLSETTLLKESVSLIQSFLSEHKHKNDCSRSDNGVRKESHPKRKWNEIYQQQQMQQQQQQDFNSKRSFAQGVDQSPVSVC